MKEGVCAPYRCLGGGGFGVLGVWGFFGAWGFLGGLLSGCFWWFLEGDMIFGCGGLWDGMVYMWDTFYFLLMVVGCVVIVWFMIFLLVLLLSFMVFEWFLWWLFYWVVFLLGASG